MIQNIIIYLISIIKQDIISLIRLNDSAYENNHIKVAFQYYSPGKIYIEPLYEFPYLTTLKPIIF